jgi:protein-tyrosine phosphatase
VTLTPVRRAPETARLTRVNRHRAPSEQDHVFRLLFVCTGNICRSPFAEILTRHLLVGRLGGRLASEIEVASAGVQAVVGGQMHPDSRHELMPWGLDGPVAGRFTARQLRAEMVDDADLILGANPRHRSSVVECNPAGLPKTFGLREFVRLARAVDPAALPEQPVERAHALVELGRRQRGLLPPVDPGDDRVPDPMGGTADDHHRAATLIREAVSSIVDVIAPARPAVGPVRRAVPGPSHRSPDRGVPSGTPARRPPPPSFHTG